jgi:hypothetical protein
MVMGMLGTGWPLDLERGGDSALRIIELKSMAMRPEVRDERRRRSGGDSKQAGAMALEAAAEVMNTGGKVKSPGFLDERTNNSSMFQSGTVAFSLCVEFNFMYGNCCPEIKTNRSMFLIDIGRSTYLLWRSLTHPDV